MPSFIVQTTNRNYTFEIDKAEIAIGRELKNDLILDDPRVSRYHAVAHKTAEGVTFRDLGSGNGVFVNGQRIAPNVNIKLTENTQIKLGSCTLTFQDVDPLRTQEANIALREVMQKPPSDMLVTSALASYTKPEDVPALIYHQELEKKERILRLFYDLSLKLSSVFSLEEIYHQAFDILFSVTPVSRCFIFRKNEQGEFEEAATRTRDGEARAKRLRSARPSSPRSRASASRCCSKTPRAAARNSSSKSVVATQVQSVMASPIIGPRGLLGIIYADRFDASKNSTPTTWTCSTPSRSTWA